jgi:hypothetical protein
VIECGVPLAELDLQKSMIYLEHTVSGPVTELLCFTPTVVCLFSLQVTRQKPHDTFYWRRFKSLGEIYPVLAAPTDSAYVWRLAAQQQSKRTQTQRAAGANERLAGHIHGPGI